LFGPNARGVIGNLHHYVGPEPSPVTTLGLHGEEGESHMTVLGGFTGLAFQFTSPYNVHVAVFDGPARTGTVLGRIMLKPEGHSRWVNVTVPFAGGVGRSVGFDTNEREN
jgi:hypothetical protein